MFERYTEAARRLLFFARFEASELRSRAIQNEHLLLGLDRVNAGIGSRILSEAGLSFASLSADIERRVGRSGERTPTSVEIPFSAETQRVLRYAVEEADRLLHSYIGTEHLLLGLLREEQGVAAAVLAASNLRLEDVRERLREMSSASPRPEPPLTSASRITVAVSEHPISQQDRADAGYIVQRIHIMVDELARTKPEDPKTAEPVDSIHIELHTLQSRITGT